MENANRGALNPPKKAKTSHSVSLAPGRAPSAPTRTSWPITQNGARDPSLHRTVTHCPSLTDPLWTNAPNGEVCLAYSNLDPTRSGVEGLRIRARERLTMPLTMSKCCNTLPR